MTAREIPLPARDLEWNDLRLILAICRTGSLSGAARVLGQTHSTVFRRINGIEDKTGVRFFERFPHGYIMTDAGRIAESYGERVEAEFNALGLEVLGADGKLRGRVRLTTPEAFAEDIAPGIIARFVEANPGIQVDLSPGHGNVDLTKREAEVAVRATRSPPETSFGKKVCDFRFALYSTEDYLGRAGERPLAEHDWCLIEGIHGWFVPLIWPTPEAALSGIGFQCRSTRAVMTAIAEGMGVTVLPCYVGDRCDALIRVSETIPEHDLTLWVLTHPDLRGTARVRAMMNHLYAELGADVDLYEGRRREPVVNLLN